MVKLKGKFPRLDRLEYDGSGDSVLRFYENSPYYQKHPEVRKRSIERDIYEHPYVAFNAGTLPEVVVTPDPNSTSKIYLNTYYPVTSKDYPFTGHSMLRTEGGNIINIMSDDPEYNLVTNNCSDATRCALEIATGKKINPWFFTTPLDVKDFAEKKLGGKSKNYEGSTQTVIELPTKDVRKIADYSKELKAKRQKKKLVAKNKFGGIVKAEGGTPLRLSDNKDTFNKTNWEDALLTDFFKNFGMISTDYNTNLYNYIEAIENPTREGYDTVNKIWRPPTKKGFDKNQIGIGLDLNNEHVKSFLKSKGRLKDPWLTDSEMKELQGKIIGGLETILNKHTKLSTPISDNKRVMAIGLMYHGFGPSLWNPNGPKTSKVSNALFNGSDKEMVDAVSNLYNGTYTERYKNHSNFWNN